MGRHSSARVLLAVASFLVVFAVPTRVFAGELIFAQSITTTSGNANFSTKAGRGTYPLTVTDLDKSGYTFDATNSTLTKSIAK